MIAGLEEELVFQVLETGEDEQYLSDRINALKDLDLTVDSKKVKIAIKRYKLLQEYNSQDNSRIGVIRSMRENRRKRRVDVKKSIEDLTRDEIEKLKLKPEIISLKVKDKKLREISCCNDCGSVRMRYRMAKAVRIIKNEDIDDERIYEKEKSSYILFHYCADCGSLNLTIQEDEEGESPARFSGYDPFG